MFIYFIVVDGLVKQLSPALMVNVDQPMVPNAQIASLVHHKSLIELAVRWSLGLAFIIMYFIVADGSVKQLSLALMANADQPMVPSAKTAKLVHNEE